MWISRMERKDTSWVSEPFEKGGGDLRREVWHNKCLWCKNDKGLKKQSHYRRVWEHAFQKILDFYIDFDAVW